jgi:hypothetical protein
MILSSGLIISIYKLDEGFGEGMFWFSDHKDEPDSMIASIPL